MLDLKGVLRTVLQQGLQDFGYGVRSVGYVAPSVDDNVQIVTLKRSGAQDEDDRPLIYLRRMGGPRPVQYYLGNVANALNSSDQPYANVIMVQDRVRIGIEAFQDTGGQSLVDMLMLQIPTMLLQNWQAMTWPLEAGGYGLINPTFQGNADTIKSDEVGGKAVYSNYYDFTATLPMDTSPNIQPSGTIDCIEFLPNIPNVDPNNPDFQPNP